MDAGILGMLAAFRQDKLSRPTCAGIRNVLLNQSEMMMSATPSDSHDLHHDHSLDPVVAEALEALESKDSFIATGIISQGDPRDAQARFSMASRELFNQRKLTEMVWVGRAGVEFALRQAAAAASSDPVLQTEYLANARKYAFNIASNLWPGWGDEAVEPTTADILAAVDLARVHRRLVEAESGAPDLMANARWLMGALRLALGQEQTAHYEFEMAKALFERAGQPACVWMAEGYQALALQLMGTMAGEGLRRYEAALMELRKQGDDGEFFADQLTTARRVFLSR